MAINKSPAPIAIWKSAYTKKVSTNANERIREIVMKAYENALDEENVVPSRPERKRILAQIMRRVMEDLLKKLDAN